MTCAVCGSVLAQEVRFCPHCGASVGYQPGVPYPPPGMSYRPPLLLPYTRVGRNLQALGVLWIVYAVLHALSGLIGVLFLHGIFGSHHTNWNFGWGPFGQGWMASLWPLALSSVLVGAGISVLVACALLTRQPWARVLAIVFSIFALIHLPLGTALGVYTLWVLAPRLSGDEYAALAVAEHGV
jgi:hypothetical protein